MSASAVRARIVHLLVNDHGIRITTNKGLVLEEANPLNVIAERRFVRIGDDAGVGYGAIVKVESL